MIMIRLQRVGRKNDPSFRVVVVDRRRGPKSGKALEVIGSYNPRRGEATIDAERVKYWLGVGAQASITVHNLLVDKKIVAGKKRDALPSRKPTPSNGAETTPTTTASAEAPKEEPIPEPVKEETPVA